MIKILQDIYFQNSLIVSH